MVTAWPFWYSWVGRSTDPDGPVPLMPNRLLSWAASLLCPHPDSSMAWAMVPAAGTPYFCCAAMAPGATELMNACCADALGPAEADVCGVVRLYRAAAAA